LKFMDLPAHNAKLRAISIFLAVALSCISGQALGQPTSSESLKKEALRQTLSIVQGGKDWPVQETKYFIIHYQPKMVPSPAAINELDNFAGQILGLFEVSQGFRNELGNNKISYYLCNDETIKTLTGYQTKGMADLAGRAVISSHFPHFHELVHLLVHLIQETPSEQTHPLVQEGIACLLGGRWGRAPNTILYTGWVHRSFGMGEMDAVLTQADFFSFSGGADVAYPLGAMLCEMVRREAGWAGVLDLNTRLSGSALKVASLNSESVLATIAEICRWGQKDVRNEFYEAINEIWPEYRRCGIAPLEGSQPSIPGQEKNYENAQVMMWLTGGQQVVKVTATKFPVHLMSAPTKADWGNSSLFNEHFPSKEYHGQRYGMRCSPDNISLYDYATNQLIATWVAGFTDETDACGNGTAGIVFEVSKEFHLALTTFIANASEVW